MTSATTLDPLSDFSDRLSPMVVKELRQGLRTRMFGLLMLLLHGLLILVTLIVGVDQTGTDKDWMLQGLTILCLCIIMPLRGFSAIADEIHRNTLDMLALSQLSAVRIVVGKWLSIALQSLLIALSLMPYVVANYVYGGRDLVHELQMLGLKWLIGIVIAAAIVCLSTQRQFGLRAAVIGIALLGPGIGSVAVGFMWMRFGSSGPMASAWAMASGPNPLLPLWIILAAAWLIFSFLTLAATRIAPLGSNLAVIKRLVHTLTIIILMIEAWLSPRTGTGVLAGVGLVLSFATLDALIERANRVPSTLVPFYRQGLLGRMASWFLVTGWPNGVFFSLGMTFLLTLLGAVIGDLETGLNLWLSVADIWLCATVLHLLFGRRGGDLLAPYIAITLVTLLLKMLALMIVQASGDEDALWFSMLFPSTVMSSLEMLKARNIVTTLSFDQLRWAGVGVSCIWPLILTLMAAGNLRQARPLRAEARLLATRS